ncbi:type II secretion system protein [Paenibacillus piscarius]|uniref:type II secretion system protein n=1 Tax=Paenibacillus piscarius TaxID=1089681 RepID=UPI001EE78AA3|nr:prepilin-type N-terminal cleavage/methylation domain-containing protein [Paenibacillus piscarius]
MLAQALRKRLGKAAKDEQGFTLIELLAVIVIMGIIAVIAIPMISGLIKNTGDKADLATARQIYEASRMYITTELDGKIDSQVIDVIGTAPTDSAAGTGLQGLKFLETPLVLPSTKANIVTGSTINYSGGKLADNSSGYAVLITDGTVTKKFTAEEVLKTKLK